MAANAMEPYPYSIHHPLDLAANTVITENNDDNQTSQLQNANAHFCRRWTLVDDDDLPGV